MPLAMGDSSVGIRLYTVQSRASPPFSGGEGILTSPGIPETPAARSSDRLWAPPRASTRSSLWKNHTSGRLDARSLPETP